LGDRSIFYRPTLQFFYGYRGDPCRTPIRSRAPPNENGDKLPLANKKDPAPPTKEAGSRTEAERKEVRSALKAQHVIQELHPVDKDIPEIITSPLTLHPFFVFWMYAEVDKLNRPLEFARDRQYLLDKRLLWRPNFSRVDLHSLQNIPTHESEPERPAQTRSLRAASKPRRIQTKTPPTATTAHTARLPHRSARSPSYPAAVRCRPVTRRANPIKTPMRTHVLGSSKGAVHGTATYTSKRSAVPRRPTTHHRSGPESKGSTSREGKSDIRRRAT